MTGTGDEAKMETKRLECLITSKVSVHIFWDDAICALRPVSINKNESSMKVAFH